VVGAADLSGRVGVDEITIGLGLGMDYAGDIKLRGRIVVSSVTTTTTAIQQEGLDFFQVMCLMYSGRDVSPSSLVTLEILAIEGPIRCLRDAYIH